MPDKELGRNWLLTLIGRPNYSRTPTIVSLVGDADLGVRTKRIVFLFSSLEDFGNMLRNVVRKGLACLRGKLHDDRSKRTPVPSLPTPRENLVHTYSKLVYGDIRSGIGWEHRTVTLIRSIGWPRRMGTTERQPIEVAMLMVLARTDGEPRPRRPRFRLFPRYQMAGVTRRYVATRRDTAGG